MIFGVLLDRTNRSRSPHWVAVVLTLSLGCSERTVDDEPDREALCALNCEQVFGACNPQDPTELPGAPQTVEACRRTCAEGPVWSSDCRFEFAAAMACTNDLDCDEYRTHWIDPQACKCSAAELELASCP